MRNLDGLAHLMFGADPNAYMRDHRGFGPSLAGRAPMAQPGGGGSMFGARQPQQPNQPAYGLPTRQPMGPIGVQGPTPPRGQTLPTGRTPADGLEQLMMGRFGSSYGR